MNRWLVAFVILTGCNLIGCSNNEMSGEKPPKVLIEIENETYETILGSYCWGGLEKSTCVDTAGPIKLLEGKKPIRVKPGETISFMMNYEPKPNEINVVKINDNKESDVVVKDNQITAPMQKGVFYYSYRVGWMDEKKTNVSNGDAFYAFVLDVN
ncbi:hypothetical protein ABES80_20315 [Bacillus gobiensis]|uniref:hypothetical protein n=1 Tax=Bacillus gobiensis TaxID=1441095 RepID=UPI003D1E8C50